MLKKGTILQFEAKIITKCKRDTVKYQLLGRIKEAEKLKSEKKSKIWKPKQISLFVVKKP